MNEINEIVLESAVIILSGGTDKRGVPLLTFPVDSADMVDIYPIRDILDLMKTFVDLCGGKVSVLADLQRGWSTECMTKLSNLLDKLQTSRKKCISVVYFIHSKPSGSNLQRPLTRSKIPSTYTIKHLNSLDDLYLYIDKSQMTTDYGGTLQYNHVAWVDFQRTYLPMVTKADAVAKALPRLEEKINKLQEETVNKCNDSNKTFINIVKTKYEQLLKKHDVRELVEDCQDAVDRLQHPDSDPTLIQTHVAIVTDTKTKLTSLLNELEKSLDDIECVVSRTREECLLFAKLKDCEDNTNEAHAIVAETIELMTSQADGLPIISASEVQAKYNRDLFIRTVLTPSQDIIACATSILQDLHGGNDTSTTAYTKAEKVAKRLSDSIQPFIEHLNHLNEMYTRVHLFHVIVSKTIRWNENASRFISKTFKCHHNKHKTRMSQNLKDNVDIEADKRQDNDTVIPKLKLDDDFVDTSEVCVRLVAPENWEDKLRQFNTKHPTPKKKHVRLLNKCVPSNVDQKCRVEAELLAERTLFILQFLLKQDFKTEDILMIQKWTYNTDDTGLELCTDVTRV